MKRKIYLLLLLLFCVVNIILSIYISIIPDMIVYVVGLIFLMLIWVICFLINRQNRFFVVIGLLLSIFMFVSNCLCTFVLVVANNFLDTITNDYVEVNNYSVVVLDSSDYDNILDILDMDIGVIGGDDNYDKAVSKLESKIDINTISYDNVFSMINDLLDEKIDIIFLNESYISVINDGIVYFSDSIKVLDVISIKEEKEVVKNNVQESFDNSFNVYISGIDTYGEISTVSRSDVNIVMSVNFDTNKILLTNIPRDMYVVLDGTGGIRDKLTHAGLYGIDTSIKTIEGFLDTDINYYVRINFNSLIRLVDYLGGIDVISDYEFESGGRYFKVGVNYNLNGKEALAFARNRYSFSDGDRQRGRNQQKVIEAIINKITSSGVNTYFELLSVLEKSFQTNISRGDINNIIDMQFKNGYSWNIESISVDGYDHYDYTYTYPWQKLYVMLVDENSLNETKDKINNTLE